MTMVKENQVASKLLPTNTLGTTYVMGVANTIANQLKHPNIQIYWSWGAHNFQALCVENNEGVKMPSLRFKSNGRKFKGYVIVMLNDCDYYNIEFVTTRGNLKEYKEDIDCFQLQEVIDEYIEKVQEYVF